MPRKPPSEHVHTPFGDLLLDVMYNQRAPLEPPLTIGQLAIRLGISRMTLQTWIYRGVVPSVDVAMQIFAQLHIPLERALHAYETANLPVPPLTETETQTRQHPGRRAHAGAHTGGEDEDASAPDADPWTAMIAQTQADLRAAGMDEHTIGAVIDRIRATQMGSRPLAAHIAAEHAEHAEHAELPSPRPAGRPDQHPEPDATGRATPPTKRPAKG